MHPRMLQRQPQTQQTPINRSYVPKSSELTPDPCKLREGREGPKAQDSTFAKFSSLILSLVMKVGSLN